MKCKICHSKTKLWYKELFDDRHGYPKKFDIRKCIKCTFAQTSPQLSANKIASIYSKYYPWKAIDVKNIKLKDYKIPPPLTIWRKGLGINSQYRVKPGSKVLDIGCGLGFSLLELKNNNCDAYGIDPDINALKLAKKFNLKFKKAFIEDNPFPSQKFDYIIANQVLEHTNNPINFLKVIKSRLKDNGEILLSFPNTDSLTRYLFKHNWLHWHIPYHLNFFNRKSVQILVNKSGLKIKSIKTITPNMWTNLQVRRLTQNPKVGLRDIFWDGKSVKTNSKNYNLFLKINSLLEEYNIINRLIDSIGFGESFVITLQKV